MPAHKHIVPDGSCWLRPTQILVDSGRLRTTSIPHYFGRPRTTPIPLRLLIVWFRLRQVRPVVSPRVGVIRSRPESPGFVRSRQQSLGVSWNSLELKSSGVSWRWLELESIGVTMSRLEQNACDQAFRFVFFCLPFCAYPFFWRSTSADSGRLRSTLDDSGQFRTTSTSNGSGRFWATPDNTGRKYLPGSVSKFSESYQSRIRLFFQLYPSLFYL